ncbi:MAG: cbb3-type cytochrome c oxidase subunit I [candidate division WOR-3 bacterium]
MKMEGYLRSAVMWHIYVAIASITIGVIFGLLQVLSRAGIYVISPNLYYQGLTMHGVLNAVVFTTFFIVGFLYVITETSLKERLNKTLVYLSFFVMLLGAVLAAYTLLTNKATVLYTFYPPLQAHPLFYIGATLLIVGSWIAILNTILTFLRWRKNNPGQRTPGPMVAVISIYSVWFLATLGVAIEVLFFLIPWSLGIVKSINPQLARTLFWWFGHPLVYFWLLPAYLAWYYILPKVIGGKLYSATAARLAFIMFIVFSVPVGVHHQYSDPGITNVWKGLHAFFTFMVAVPSLITAFTVAASLEYAARQRGGNGLFGWWLKLPWGNYLFAYMISGMIAFIFGGISGIVNASYNMNQVVHNTSWIPGHFHLTLGSAVFLTFLGLSLYLTNKLMGKRIFSERLGTLSAYLWLIGVLIFSWGMMQLGRAGIPRRTNLGLSPYMEPEEKIFMIIAAIGGILMFISFVIFLINFLGTVFGKKEREVEVVEIDYAESYHPEANLSPIWDNWKVWIGIAVLLIVINYSPVFYDVFRATYFVEGAFSPFSPLPIK